MVAIKKFGALYNTVWGGEGDKCLYPTRLDTYWQGCSHNCSYCYARALLDFRGLRHPENPKFIDLKEAYRIIVKEIPEGQITRLGWMTDIYLDSGTYIKSFYSIICAPSGVKIGEFWQKHRRIHHHVNRSKTVPMIIDPKYKKGKGRFMRRVEEQEGRFIW